MTLYRNLTMKQMEIYVEKKSRGELKKISN
jgi:hypothetical protein